MPSARIVLFGDRLELREAVRREVPDRPGVYTWLGRDGERLYVGKSVHLRQRMLSYLLPGQTGPRSRQRHLAFAIDGFEWRETPGELLALLLEDALIKRYNPRHNERQRDYEERRYLLLTGDGFPTCLVVEDEPPRPGTLFGPFKDGYFVRDLAGLIQEYFGLRACPDRDPHRRSTRFDLGACPGPCRGGIPVAGYEPVARRVQQFLDGDDAWITRRLSEAMSLAVDALRFEDAAALRDRRDFCVRFGARQRFFREFRTAAVSVSEESRGLTYHFEAGQLARLRDDRGLSLDVPRELTDSVTDPRFFLDRANLVYAWLRRKSPGHEGGPTPLVERRVPG